ncbi:PBP1A family penicillin-binding protein [Bacillus lacus]|uniref:PBP1A family penicillin-binding protein n=1 Tax=Metabacillus lacus TaxID=1983721 RepID=A0A7X2LZB6_9BACI|nr:PBP1A family penicillin-binding protein [Metabacillus lacus]MRX71509.1 PBP1A family penicillin-binding protein [Metabacillus lacus]
MNRSERKARNKKRFPWKLLSTLFIFILLVTGLLFMMQERMIASQDITELEQDVYQPTVIYGKEGEVASKIATRAAEWVDIKDVPQHFIDALVATEDQNFYKHEGIDFSGIARAAVRNVQAGNVVEGGSTLTQQLAKNALLTQDQTFQRKIDEYFIAQKIEREYSKEDILELYLNRIYYGEGAWGLKRAAEVYFGKEPKDLSLSDSAVLTGLIKAPSYYSPAKDLERSLSRRNTVLGLMESQGFISSRESDEAKNEEIKVEGKQLDPYKGRFPHYVDHIFDEAMSRYGLSQNEILAGGYQIYTELDQDIQSSLEEVFKQDELFPEGTEEQIVQSGAVLLDPATGGLRALIGGRGEHSFRQFNHATQLKRQPGSTMKPIAAYTPALEQGFDIYSELEDEPLDINGYQPKNFDRSYRGKVTMYDALIHSYNIPAVWTLNEIGVGAGVNAVERFGIPLTDNDKNLSISLGGLDTGVAPIHMAEAFSVFPNEGKRQKAHAIIRIVDSDGQLVGEWNEEETQVTSKEVAEKITFMLKGVTEEGTGKAARLGDRDLALKTGSTQMPSETINGTKDQWVVGYTPNLVGALWLGYDKTDENHYLKTTSGQAAAPVFGAIMKNAVEHVEKVNFDLPDFEKEKRNSKPKKQKKKVDEQQKNEKNEEQKRKEEEKRKQEEAKQQEEAKKREEEAKRDEEKRLEEEKNQEEEQKRLEEEERKQQEEEQKRKEEEEKRKQEEEAKRKEEEQKRIEEEAKRKEEEERKKKEEEERKKKEEEERKKKEEEKPADPEATQQSIPDDTGDTEQKPQQ